MGVRAGGVVSLPRRPDILPPRPKRVDRLAVPFDLGPDAVGLAHCHEAWKAHLVRLLRCGASRP